MGYIRQEQFALEAAGLGFPQLHLATVAAQARGLCRVLEFKADVRFAQSCQRIDY